MAQVYHLKILMAVGGFPLTCRELKAHKVSRVTLVLKAHKVKLDRKVTRVSRVSKAHKVFRALQDKMVKHLHTVGLVRVYVSLNLMVRGGHM
jgi:hypothetical protein